MKTQNKLAQIALAGILWMLGNHPMAFAAATQTGETKMSHAAVEAAVDNFYAALNVMFTGDGKPVKDAWSHADDVTYMGPGGDYLIGWKQVEKEWDRQAAAKLGGKVIPEKVHIVVGETLAFLNCVEAGQNVVKGKVEPVKLRSSTIFRKENAAWKVVAHQTDLLGYMSTPK